MECTRVIRSQQLPHRKRPFIIALTANVTEEYRAKCLQSGMDLFSVSRHAQRRAQTQLRNVLWASPFSCAHEDHAVCHRLYAWLWMLPAQTKPVDVDELQRGLQTAHAEANERVMSPDIAPDKLQEAQAHRSGY